MNKIKIVCLNINGLNSRTKQDKLCLWRSHNNIDILILVDTRIQSLFSHVSKRLKATSHLATPNRETAGGICIISFQKNIVIAPVQNASNHRILTARIHGFKSPFTIMALYAPANGAARKDFFSNTLTPIIQGLEDKEDIILAGDFNFVEKAHLDRSHKTTNPPLDPGAMEFAAATELLHIRDPFRVRYPSTRQYTYKSPMHYTASRIDRMYISDSMLDAHLDFQHLIVWPGITDHCFGTLIQLSISTHPVGRNELWRMNTSYLGQPALTRRIKQICSKYQMESKTNQWWDALKTEIRDAVKEHSYLESTRVKGQITALQAEVASLTTRIMENPSNELLGDRLEKQNAKLYSYMVRKLKFYRQCAMEKTNPHSINACKLLSNLIKGRKSRTLITKLSSDTETFTNTKGILLHASTFFTRLYCHESNGHPLHPIWNVPKSNPPAEFISELCKPITEPEVKEALHTLPSGKTPGIDGLPKEFYVYYWKEMAPLLTQMITDFQNGLTPTSLPKAATVLIFKKGDPE